MPIKSGSQALRRFIQRSLHAAWLLLVIPLLSAAQTQSPPDSKGLARPALPPEVKARWRQAVAAVGLIVVRNSGEADVHPRGSAVVVSRDGLVVTNLHVVAQLYTGRPYDEIYLQLAGAARQRLQLRQRDDAHDLVLLRVVTAQPASFTALEIGDSRKLDLLDDLVIIGYPEKGGSTATLSLGAPGGVVEGKDEAGEWIKTDARLLHGNSGGAAVNAEGKLIGIPTKVEVDETSNNLRIGAVGFLRPAHLVSRLLEREQALESQSAEKPAAAPPPTNMEVGKGQRATVMPEPAMIKVRGLVKSAPDGKPIAGARVGLLQPGSELNVASLITWGGTNADGLFEFEKPVRPGRYTLRAKVIGDERFEAFTSEIEIKADTAPLVIEVRPARGQ